jgi:hypothetical protein
MRPQRMFLCVVASTWIWLMLVVDDDVLIHLQQQCEEAIRPPQDAIAKPVMNVQLAIWSNTNDYCSHSSWLFVVCSDV